MTPEAQIDAACAAFAQQENIPGIVAGIVQGGRLVHAAGDFPARIAMPLFCAVPSSTPVEPRRRFWNIRNSTGTSRST